MDLLSPAFLLRLKIMTKYSTDGVHPTNNPGLDYRAQKHKGFRKRLNVQLQYNNEAVEN